MKWEELRNLYPHQYVKLEVVESHIENDKGYVDDVALIKVISDSKEAMR